MGAGFLDMPGGQVAVDDLETGEPLKSTPRKTEDRQPIGRGCRDDTEMSLDVGGGHSGILLIPDLLVI